VAENDKSKLPETPFNGVVVSVNQAEMSHFTGHTHFDVAICSLHDSSVIVFHGFEVKLLDPRRHLRPGLKVRVKDVKFAKDLRQGDSKYVDVGGINYGEQPVIAATIIEFDYRQLAEGFKTE